MCFNFPLCAGSAIKHNFPVIYLLTTKKKQTLYIYSWMFNLLKLQEHKSLLQTAAKQFDVCVQK